MKILRPREVNKVTQSDFRMSLEPRSNPYTETSVLMILHQGSPYSSSISSCLPNILCTKKEGPRPHTHLPLLVRTLFRFSPFPSFLSLFQTSRLFISLSENPLLPLILMVMSPTAGGLKANRTVSVWDRQRNPWATCLQLPTPLQEKADFLSFFFFLRRQIFMKYRHKDAQRMGKSSKKKKRKVSFVKLFLIHYNSAGQQQKLTGSQMMHIKGSRFFLPFTNYAFSSWRLKYERAICLPIWQMVPSLEQEQKLKGWRHRHTDSFTYT